MSAYISPSTAKAALSPLSAMRSECSRPRSEATRLLHMQSHGWTWSRIMGLFKKKPLRLNTHPLPVWNAGARPHIPHRGATWKQSVPSARTQVWFFHVNPKNSLRLTVRACFFFFCRMLLYRLGKNYVDPADSTAPHPPNRSPGSCKFSAFVKTRLQSVSLGDRFLCILSTMSRGNDSQFRFKLCFCPSASKTDEKCAR